MRAFAARWYVSYVRVLEKKFISLNLFTMLNGRNWSSCGNERCCFISIWFFIARIVRGEVLKLRCWWFGYVLSIT